MLRRRVLNVNLCVLTIHTSSRFSNDLQDLSLFPGYAFVGYKRRSLRTCSTTPQEAPTARVGAFLLQSVQIGRGKTMRKINRLLSIVVALFVFAATASGAHAQGGTNQIPPTLPDLKGRKVVAVTSNDYTPFSFKDAKSGKTLGYEYELLHEIANRLNIVIEHQESSFEGMIAAVSKKQYDLGHIGISITDERKGQVDFSDAYVTIEQKLLVRAGEKRFTDAKTFTASAALKFGAQPGTTSYFSASDIVGKDAEKSRIVGYDSFALAVTALVAGDVDAVVTDAVSGAGFIGANAGKLQLLNEVISTDPLGFIFPKGSDLVAPFNQALASLKYDGYLKYLENKWFFLYQPPTN